MSMLDASQVQRGTLGHVAYEAHCVAYHKIDPRATIDGFLTWEQLRPAVRAHWDHVARAVQVAVLKPLLYSPADAPDGPKPPPPRPARRSKPKQRP